MDMERRLWRCAKEAREAGEREASLRVIRVAKRCPQAFPKEVRALQDLAKVMQSENAIELAVHCCRELTKIQPENPDYWLDLGFFLILACEWKESLNVLAHAAELAPFDQYAWGLRAYALDSLGLRDEAAEMDRKARLLESWRHEPQEN